VRAGFAWVRRAAHLLGREGLTGAQARRRLRVLLGRMRAEAARAEGRGEGELAAGLRHFVKVSGSYEPGLFWCYDVAGLPRTNNALEQLFGSQRYHERRASGRKGASPTLVVRGSVRLVAAVATRLREASGEQLAPRDVGQWQQLRQRLQERRDARRQQRRFRRDPKAYLRALEELALQLPLPA
jgi:hypothetical protein